MQRFLWERGAYVGADVGLFNFQDLLHAQENTKGKEKAEKAQEVSCKVQVKTAVNFMLSFCNSHTQTGRA